MKHIAYAAALAAVCSCTPTDEFADSPTGNFEALWKTIDEHYCFLPHKAELYGLDWDEVHRRYSSMVHEGMTRAQLFEVLAAMLSELKDGHVNLYSAFDIGREWSWKEDWPRNYDESMERELLGTSYRIMSGMKCRVLEDNIAYVRCPSFSSEMSEGGLDEMMIAFAPCNAMVIDIRENGGGLVSAAMQLASRFTNEPLHVGYIRHKTGKGRSDFSEMEEQWLRPGAGARWQKPVAVLTNRGVFSSANEFAKYMACCPGAVLVGDKTGGGGGLPFSSELPCGWSVRFSACPMYDNKGNLTEDGIEPDVVAELGNGWRETGRDGILEKAREVLRSMAGKRF